MNTFTMMCGLPGSGKSTYAKKILDEATTVYLSSDDLREEMYGNADDQLHNEEVFNEMYHRTIKAIENGKNVIYDACNISFKKRYHLLKQLKKYNIRKEIIVVYANYETCLSQNESRSRKVPEYVIRRMIENFYFPQYFEGWDKIKIVTRTKQRSVFELFYGTMNDDVGLCYQAHDNPHHSLSIGYHCIKCCEMAMLVAPKDENVAVAAILHDIGKPFVKTFTNRKGEHVDIAHYYQHQFVSGYFAVKYLSNKPDDDGYNVVDDDNIEVLGLIDYHMHPYFWKQNDKMREKYKAIWGTEFYNKILKLHEADKAAH